MLKDLVLRLRYLGSIPRVGYIEYGFQIAEKDKHPRQAVLTIETAFPQRNDLKFQEAPDLCYQEVLADLNDERPDSGTPTRLSVTALDITHYRDLHPVAKLRKTLKEIRSSHRMESHRVNELRAGNIPAHHSAVSTGAKSE
jgi:hypothetical protein